MKTLFLILAAVVVAKPLSADVVIREFHASPIGLREDAAVETGSRTLLRRAAPDAVDAGPVSFGSVPPTLHIYPVVGPEFYIPYYVDLDPGSQIQDWQCGRNTFEKHPGHDAYIRSFTEQAIGAPVFAPLPGIVEEVHDGEPDQNVNGTDGGEDATLSNYVKIRHGDYHTTSYLHLKKGSVTVRPGQFVTSGTQIAQIGSSGRSSGPHLHFETLYKSRVYEPLVGPCRPGRSAIAEAVPPFQTPVVLGVALGPRRFFEFPTIPHDDAPRTGTFLTGRSRRVYMQAVIGRLPANSTYQLTVESPSGGRFVADTATLTSRGEMLGNYTWTLEIDVTRTGTWLIHLDVNGSRLLTLPFTAVGNDSDVVNRAPNAISATIDPAALHPNRPAICSVTGPLVGDPDYDVVRYHYQWRVGDRIVREVTSAMRADVLAQQHVTSGTDLSCTVTPSDGKVQGTAVTAHGRPPYERRRAVR